MAKLIDKDALVAKIEKCKKDIPTGCTWGDQIEEGSRIGHEEAYDRVLRFIDTLEVKEVDFEKEIQAFALLELEPLKIYDANVGISITMHQLYQCAKHFFALGLKAKQG